MKILILDGDPVILKLATNLLKDAGYSVSFSDDPTVALAKLLKGNTYDLLVTDIKLPKMSGLEIIRKLRKTNSSTKTIIMTESGNLKTAQLALKEGAYDYILKPFDDENLCQAVRNALKRKELEEENARLKELAGLFQISELISTDSTPQNLLQLILRSIIKQLHADQGSIMLLDPKDKVLKIAAAVGLDERIVQNTKIKVGEGIAGRVVQHAKPVLVTNIDEHSLFSRHSHGYPDRSFISASLELDEEVISFPLVSSKKILGVINIRKKTSGSPFNKADLELVSTLATQTAIAIENSRFFADLNSVYMGVMQSMVAITEARDVYLRGHTQRVTKLCLQLGQIMGLGKKELTHLRYAATVHDIGKLAISESILNKQEELTPEEFNIIKTHPILGANILAPLKFLDEARQIVSHHHERFDGQGYPDGLSTDQLSLSTDIIILADSYDAMNSNRAYREALSKQQIIEEVIQNKGKQFHPQVVNMFLKLLRDNQENTKKSKK